MEYRRKRAGFKPHTGRQRELRDAIKKLKEDRAKHSWSLRKARARAAVSRAIRYGLLKRLNRCQNCGAEGYIHGHHTNYHKPLAVQWLCVPCHARTHAI